MQFQLAILGCNTRVGPDVGEERLIEEHEAIVVFDGDQLGLVVTQSPSRLLESPAQMAVLVVEP